MKKTAAKKIPRLAEIFKLLKEAKCPYCGDPNAYVGFSKVDCPTCGGDPKRARAVAVKPKQKGSINNINNFFASKPGYDHFSPDRPSFERYVRDEMKKFFGHGWDADIDSAFGPGTVKKVIDDCWKNNWSDYETIDQLGNMYDIVQQGDVHHYKHMADIDQKIDGPSGVPRSKRPMSPNDFV